MPAKIRRVTDVTEAARLYDAGLLVFFRDDGVVEPLYLNRVQALDDCAIWATSPAGLAVLEEEEEDE